MAFSLSEITDTQFNLIHHIRETEKATITSLTQSLELIKSTLTTAVKKLIKMELVRKRASLEDK
ncbi:MAG: MarR family transcriptional regulator [Clostridiales bacterium]|nr:MarR family transcriptional regulator [Clostridiales bacterium]